MNLPVSARHHVRLNRLAVCVALTLPCVASLAAEAESAEPVPRCGLPYWYADGSKPNWDVSNTSAAGWTRWPTEYDNAFVNLEHSFGNGWKVRANASHGDRSSDSYLL